MQGDSVDMLLAKDDRYKMSAVEEAEYEESDGPDGAKTSKPGKTPNVISMNPPSEHYASQEMSKTPLAPGSVAVSRKKLASDGDSKVTAGGSTAGAEDKTAETPPFRIKA